MKKGGTGGGSTISGLIFEERVDILTLLKKMPGYAVVQPEEVAGAGSHIMFNGKQVARCFKKHEFYEYLNESNVDWKDLISRKLLPDNALLVVVPKTLYIIEVKFQGGEGSVDEKLQTCDFKRKQYLKLVEPLGLKVEYVYVLNNWFKKPKYKDVLEYIHSVGCHYKFGEIPLSWLGLPAPE